MYKIFLAWQSQNKTTASFIKRQLDKVKDEFEHIGIEVEIIKSPTQDESGSPDINDAIWKQIQSSDIFIADMSFVSDTIDISNGNVMYETGIADAILGSSRVIILCDENTNIEKICFDINHKRISKINTANKDQHKDLFVWVKAAFEEADRQKYIKDFTNDTYAEELLFLVNYFYRLKEFNVNDYSSGLKMPVVEQISQSLKDSVIPLFYLSVDFTKYIKNLEEKLLQLYPFSHKRINWMIMNIISNLKEYQRYQDVTKYSFIQVAEIGKEQFNEYEQTNFYLKDKSGFSMDKKTVLFNANSKLYFGKNGWLILDGRVEKKDDNLFKHDMLLMNDSTMQNAVVSKMGKIKEDSINIMANLIQNILKAIFEYFYMANIEMNTLELPGVIDLKL